MSYSNQFSLFDVFENQKRSDLEEEKYFEEIVEDKEIEETKISLLALAKVPGIGYATIRKLFDGFGGKLAYIWYAEDEMLLEKLVKSSSPPKQIVQFIKENSTSLREEALVEYSNLKRRNIDLILRGTPAYPERLKALKSGPMWLFAEGNTKILVRSLGILHLG